jgi:DNA/RNA-binding domain of Phe-tRNA-synthetase-like protein
VTDRQPTVVTVDEAVTSIVRPVAELFDGVSVVDRTPALTLALTDAARRLRAVGDQALAGRVVAVRTMYKRVGLDPTRTRPSSEALLRRVRRGDELPRVNALVDVINWCSVELQLPYGLYDRAAIAGAVTLRLGRPDEQYPGIRKDVVHLEGRLTLADSQGAFGNPTSDSARTAVTTTTKEALVVIFVPVGLPTSVSDEALGLTRARVDQYCR